MTGDVHGVSRRVGMGMGMGKKTRDIYKTEERKGRKRRRVRSKGFGWWLGRAGCFALIPVYASDISC